MNYVAVLRPGASDRLVASIQVAYSFYGSTFDLANGLVYVVNPTGENGTGNPGFPTPPGPKNGSVMALDPTSRKFTGTEFQVGYGPTAIAYDAANRNLYVTDQYGGNVSIISPSSRTVANVVIGPREQPIALAVNIVQDLVYVANYNGSSVSLINGSTNRLVLSATVGSSPDALTYDSESNLLYVANCLSNNVSVLNATSLHQLRSIPVGECPADLAIDSSSNELLVANFYSPTGGYSNVTFVNLTSGVSDGSVLTAFGARALCIDPANGYLYVANAASSNLTIINLSTRDHVAPGIQVDAWPDQSYPTTITYDPIEQDLVIPTVFASAIYVVGDLPSLVSLNVSPNPGEVGVNTDVTVQGSGGTPPYAARYSSLLGGCFMLDSLTLDCKPSASGNFTVIATLTDAHGFEVLASASFRVSPALNITLFSSVPSEIDVGSSTRIAATITGGVTPLRYSYAGLPPGCSSVDMPNLDCTPAIAGTFAVDLTVVDALGVRAVGAASFVVHSSLIVSFTSPEGGRAVVGQSVSLFALASGGATPFRYGYSGLPPGCSAGNGPIVRCNLTTAGVWQPIVNVTDVTGQTGRAEATLVVDRYVPIPVISAFYADPSSVTLGESSSLVVVVNGTAGPWSLYFANLPVGCTSANSTRLVCIPRQAGFFSITVDLVSNGSMRDSASTSLTVSSIPASGLFGPQVPEWGIGIAIGAAGVGVAWLTALMAARRKRRRTEQGVAAD
ncbi:MAG TPA: YncE family protein [Nitrospira sp.]|nr:YncE family protein [Nitrospira sp.]